MFHLIYPDRPHNCTAICFLPFHHHIEKSDATQSFGARCSWKYLLLVSELHIHQEFPKDKQYDIPRMKSHSKEVTEMQNR